MARRGVASGCAQRADKGGHYWIDRANGVGGFWAAQIFPFADPTSVVGFLDFEKAVYDNAV